MKWVKLAAYFIPTFLILPSIILRYADMQKRATHATQGRGNLSKIAEIILKSLSEVSYFTSKRHFWTQNDEITSLFHGF